MGKCLVNWDVDKVWYPGISTSYCSEKSKLDPRPFIQEYTQNGWFSEQDVERWVKDYNNGKYIQSVAHLAQMFTDFLYKMTKDDKPIFTKEHTIQAKQSLLRDMTLGDVKATADSVPLTHGLNYAIDTFKKNGIYQTAFSDGLGPFVCYLMDKFGMNHKGFVPAIVEIDGKEVSFTTNMLSKDDAKLTGKVEKYDKAAEFFKAVQNTPLWNVAIIDDSGANVEKMLKPVQEKGGLAVGYNPTPEHRPIFDKYSIPILKGKSLEPFAELVLDPSKIKEFCE